MVCKNEHTAKLAIIRWSWRFLVDIVLVMNQYNNHHHFILQLCIQGHPHIQGRYHHWWLGFLLGTQRYIVHV